MRLLRKFTMLSVNVGGTALSLMKMVAFELVTQLRLLLILMISLLKMHLIKLAMALHFRPMTF